MCGLVGILLKSDSGGITSDTKIFSDLLFIDTLRGADATGVALITKDAGATVIKEATPAYSFMEEKKYEDIKQDFISKGKALLGHNRKKTIGPSDDSGAHPFVFNNNTIFMHNGTLSSWKHLDKDAKLDSEALGSHLSKCDGDPQKIEEALSTVYGAYACVWYDQKLEKVFLLRNAERPLWLGKNSFGYFYASEPGFMTIAASRNNTKIDEYIEVKPHELHTFDLSPNSQLTHTVVPLTVKKTSPTTTSVIPITSYTKQTKIGNAFNKKLLRSTLKQLRTSFIGKTISFCVNKSSDIITTNKGSWIYGEVLEPDTHVGEFDIHSLLFSADLKNKQELDIINTIYKGEVVAVNFDNHLDSFEFYLQPQSKNQISPLFVC